MGTKSVALVGFAPETVELARKTKADEIWALYTAEQHLGLPRIDRLFEIHPYEFLLDPSHPSKQKGYIEYLKAPHTFPIYMQEAYPDFPASVKYPLDEINRELFPKLWRGDRNNREMIKFYTSTFSYMLALAIYEGFDIVELYGFEMGTETEWRYQRDSASFMLGVAVGRGVTVYLPKITHLLRARMYGYEALHMITRSHLESAANQYSKAKNEALAKSNEALGKWNEFTKTNGKHGNAQKAEALWREAQTLTAEAHFYEGAYQATLQYIRQTDMEVVDVGNLQSGIQGGMALEGKN